MASDLKSAASITVESMCMLLQKATFMAAEALVASKGPQRPNWRSALNSVASITYVPMLLWPLNASLR